jgi:hypothetical protein
MLAASEPDMWPLYRAQWPGVSLVDRRLFLYHPEIIFPFSAGSKARDRSAYRR